LTHRVIATVGLTFDIAGALFVAAEAVRLDNLRRLAQYLDSATFPFLRRFPYTRTKEQPDPTRVDYVVATVSFVYLFTALIVAAALAGNFLSDRSGPIQLLFVLGVVLLAFVVPRLLAAPLVRGLIWIDRGTPSGGVGIIGAAALIFGFALQVVAVWTR
jgi:hypothetical protein